MNTNESLSGTDRDLCVGVGEDGDTDVDHDVDEHAQEDVQVRVPVTEKTKEGPNAAALCRFQGTVFLFCASLTTKKTTFNIALGFLSVA